jgi:thiol-disulfide isomerase/thioredoxin|tara:strand:+ start:862 stop:1077 length:216 start_codon:yes stop_codon:yes gene_type:complete
MGKQPIYIVFWATWCPSCLREIPNLKAINEKFGDDITFVAINVDRTHFWYNLTTSESKKPVLAYLKKQRIN